MSRNYLQNAGLETASPVVWTLAGSAARYVPAEGLAHVGSAVLGLYSQSGIATSTATQTMTLASGRLYELRFYVQQIDAADANQALALQFDKGNGTYTEFQVLTALTAAGWNYVSCTLPATTGASCGVRFVAGYINALDLGSQEWWLDSLQLIYGGSAVRLAERGIAAVLTLLRAEMAHELEILETERGDGMTLVTPASSDFQGYDKSEIAGGRVQFSVYEDEFDFTSPYSDLAAMRAEYELPLTVAVTFFPTALGPEDAITRLRRYVAAVHACILRNPSLNEDDDAIQSAVVTSIRPPRAVAGQDEDRSIKVRAELQLVLRCEEVL